ncbi:MAG: N-acetyltransferase [Firmicutes bacterium]|nr:N-acetyltransferase [Bacillota bacterium]
MLQVRKATSADFERIMEIYRSAQDHMIESGNPDQWGHFYPAPELVRSDIEEGVSLVITDGEQVYGVFALFSGDEPTYRHIENGGWLNEEPYVTIHRIAGDGRAHGIFRCAADYCKGISSNVRIDTHENNTIMQKQIEKCGFARCGIIYVQDGSPRIAYHWHDISK